MHELGRLERTLFTLHWLQDLNLRQRVQAGLNKGESRNALARAVFFNRLGKVRERNYEDQRYRASDLNLAVAAIVLWNTIYLERAVDALKNHGAKLPDGLTTHLSPLGWFGGIDAEINRVRYTVAYKGNDLMRSTTIERNGIVEATSQPTPIRRK